MSAESMTTNTLAQAQPTLRPRPHCSPYPTSRRTPQTPSDSRTRLIPTERDPQSHRANAANALPCITAVGAWRLVVGGCGFFGAECVGVGGGRGVLGGRGGGGCGIGLQRCRGYRAQVCGVVWGGGVVIVVWALVSLSGRWFGGGVRFFMGIFLWGRLGARWGRLGGERL